MKPRQYKKLCKKAKDLLTLRSGSFYNDIKYYEHFEGRGQPFTNIMVWGVLEGPDYFGECDWTDTWELLSNRVYEDTVEYRTKGWKHYRRFMTAKWILQYARTHTEIS